jgi:hypothetical protein
LATKRAASQAQKNERERERERESERERERYIHIYIYIDIHISRNIKHKNTICRPQSPSTHSRSGPGSQGLPGRVNFPGRANFTPAMELTQQRSRIPWSESQQNSDDSDSGPTVESSHGDGGGSGALPQPERNAGAETDGVYVSGFRVYGLWLSVKGSGFMVDGLGFRA